MGGVMDPVPHGTLSPIRLCGDLKAMPQQDNGRADGFDTLINELSRHIDLDSTVRDAAALCICAGENGAASIPPGTPPSLPLDDGILYPQDDDVF